MKFLQKLSENRIFIGLLLSTLVFAILFPSIFFLRATPMAQLTWELQDPAVGTMNFIPGLAALKQALFEHHTLLWTNLRNFGAPLLGNDVQVAPLFPLTIALLWAPHEIFWNLQAISRIVLLGLGTFLIATDLFKFRKFQAFIFLLNVVFALWFLRWLNHPFQNGLLASVWYVYFTSRRLLMTPQKFGKARFWGMFWIFFSAYSLLTCGFPEGAAIGALLAVVTATPIFLVKALKREKGLGSYFADFTVAHFIAFCLASPQIFALSEFVKLTGAEFRRNIGLHQLEDWNFLWHIVVPLKFGPPSGPFAEFLHIIPLFLFLTGILTFFPRIKKISTFDISALLAGLFYVFKVFSLWPAFNQLIGNLPILDQCWFTVYFVPVFLWFYSYFAAKGFGVIEESWNRKPQEDLGWREGLLTVTAVLTFVLFFTVENHTSNVQLGHANYAVIGLLLFLFVCSHYRLVNNNFFKKTIFFTLLATILVFPFYISQPSYFIPFEVREIDLAFRNQGKADYFKPLLKDHGIDLIDIRERNEQGDFADSGYLTLDNGAPAVLTKRAQEYRRTLFEVPWAGYLPLGKALYPYSWQISSAGLVLAKDSEITRIKEKDPLNHFKVLGHHKDLTLLYDSKTLSRAYLADRCIPSQGWNHSSQLLQDSKQFHPGNVTIEDLNGDALAFCENFHGKTEAVKIESDQGSKITLTSVQGPALLVLNDSFYPGWKAIDLETNQELKILPANINFKGLILPENRQYRIQYSYQPYWLYPSYGLLFLALGTMGFTYSLAYRRKYR